MDVTFGSMRPDQNFLYSSKSFNNMQKMKVISLNLFAARKWRHFGTLSGGEFSSNELYTNAGATAG
jgi:hypothetical protein